MIADASHSLPVMPERVGLAELGRSSNWRDAVNRDGIIEISEHNRPRYFVVTPDYLARNDAYTQALELKLSEMESELDRLDIEHALLRDKAIAEQGELPLSGPKLKAAALDLMEKAGLI